MVEGGGVELESSLPRDVVAKLIAARAFVETSTYLNLLGMGEFHLDSITTAVSQGVIRLREDEFGESEIALRLSTVKPTLLSEQFDPVVDALLGPRDLPHIKLNKLELLYNLIDDGWALALGAPAAYQLEGPALVAMDVLSRRIVWFSGA